MTDEFTCVHCGSDLAAGERLREAALAYVAVRDHDDIEGAENVLSYASEEWRAFEALRAALAATAEPVR
jgi:hypothetical protein